MADLDPRAVQAFLADPEVVQFYQMAHQIGTGPSWNKMTPEQRAQFAAFDGSEARSNALLQRYGIDPSQYIVRMKPDGSIGVDKQDWLERHGEQVIKAGTIGAAGLIGATALGALAGGGGAAGGGGGGSSAATSAGGAGGGTGSAVGGAAASGWRSWLPKVLEAGIPAAEAIREGRAAQGAAKEATAQQTQATQLANQRLTNAGNVAGQVYNQQRTDYQNLANQPYQTLGGLMGIQIPDVTPLALSPTASLTSGGTGLLHPGTVRNPATGQPEPSSPTTTAAQGRTLADVGRSTNTLSAPSRALLSQSSYSAPQGGAGTVTMKTPAGKLVMVPQAKVAEAQAQGGQVVS